MLEGEDVRRRGYSESEGICIRMEKGSRPFTIYGIDLHRLYDFAIPLIPSELTVNVSTQRSGSGCPFRHFPSSDDSCF